MAGCFARLNKMNWRIIRKRTTRLWYYTYDTQITHLRPHRSSEYDYYFFRYNLWRVTRAAEETRADSGESVRPMEALGERRRAATRSGRFGAARLGFRLSSDSCLVAVAHGARPLLHILDYTDAKRFEVINGTQHDCGRVVNGPNAACILSVVVTSWCLFRITLSRVRRRRAPCCCRWYDVIECRCRCRCRCRWCRASVTVSSSSSFSLLFLSLPSSYTVRHASC